MPFNCTICPRNGPKTRQKPPKSAQCAATSRNQARAVSWATWLKPEFQGHLVHPQPPTFCGFQASELPHKAYCRRPAGIGGCRRGSRRTRTLPPWVRRRCRRSLTCSTPSVMTCPASRECACQRRVDPQYPYGQAETEASLAQVLSDQQALAWRAHELWQRDAAAAGLHSQEATALLQHLRRVDPGLSPASVEDLRAALDQQLHQLERGVEKLRGVLRSNRRRSIKDYWRGR